MAGYTILNTIWKNKNTIQNAEIFLLIKST